MKTDMESIAQMAGVRAKETDRVSIEFTKDDLLIYISWLEVVLDLYKNLESFGTSKMPESTNTANELLDKLKQANLDWEF